MQAEKDELPSVASSAEWLVNEKPREAIKTMIEQAELIAELQREVEGLRALARAVIAELEDPPDAPGHFHSRPGIWDDDNGSKSGTACKWCATWRAFKRATAIGGGNG